MSWWLILLAGIALAIIAIGIHDILQRRHAILRNFPVVGHLRYMLESIGPELRQYVVAGNDEELPFSRDQRRVIYATAKKQNAYFGFGTDNDISHGGYAIIKHHAFPVPNDIGPDATLPSPKVLGEWRDRPHKFRPESLITVSAMSFGSLSGAAVEAINRGCAGAHTLHNTGEGGVSKHHLHGGDLIYQLGTGYFGARNPDGTFSIERLCESVALGPVRAIEIKLSQGAKPGHGGVLPGKKVTAEIAEARGVPIGQTVHSPNAHSAFGNVDEMIDFIETIADATGLPVGIKSAVGQQGFWDELAERMRTRGEGPDYVAVDGGEGGTGAAPLTFADHVSLPFRVGFSRVYGAFARADMNTNVVFIGSGKLGFTTDAMIAFALGADMIAIAREALMSIGCIQAQRCHTGHCPAGVATQNKWLARGLDPTLKSERMANYLRGLRKEILEVSHACGAKHPALVPITEIELMDEPNAAMSLTERFGMFDHDVVRLTTGQRKAIEVEMDRLTAEVRNQSPSH